MLRMVVGFMFWNNAVLLVRKKKPSWQENLYNGVGGKCEGNEAFINAMVREFAEETTVQTKHEDWRPFCTETGPGDGDGGYQAMFFKCRVANFQETPVHNDVGEYLLWASTLSLDRVRVIGNLRWLIPLALDWREHNIVQVEALSDIREKAAW